MPDFSLAFNGDASDPRRAAADFLDSRGIKYTKGPGGLLVVNESINLANKGLTALPDLSHVAVKGGFSCKGNDLKSLKGAPASVGGAFDCSYNPSLESLEFAPGMVGKEFICIKCPLTSLESCPQAFSQLLSDFGTFNKWDEVPQKLRISPESLAKDATTLSGTVHINKPLNFRMGIGANNATPA